MLNSSQKVHKLVKVNPSKDNFYSMNCKKHIHTNQETLKETYFPS